MKKSSDDAANDSLIGLSDPTYEQNFGDEQADAEVFVNGRSVGLEEKKKKLCIEMLKSFRVLVIETRVRLLVGPPSAEMTVTGQHSSESHYTLMP